MSDQTSMTDVEMFNHHIFDDDYDDLNLDSVLLSDCMLPEPSMNFSELASMKEGASFGVLPGGDAFSDWTFRESLYPIDEVVGLPTKGRVAGATGAPMSGEVKVKEEVVSEIEEEADSGAESPGPSVSPQSSTASLEGSSSDYQPSSPASVTDVAVSAGHMELSLHHNYQAERNGASAGRSSDQTARMYYIRARERGDCAVNQIVAARSLGDAQLRSGLSVQNVKPVMVMGHGTQLAAARRTGQPFILPKPIPVKVGAVPAGQRVDGMTQISTRRRQNGNHTSAANGAVTPGHVKPDPTSPVVIQRKQLTIEQMYEHLSSDIPTSGTLILTEEEHKSYRAEGISLPRRLPLSKSEERNLKRIRRKIKNRLAAQESRKKQKDYVSALEIRVESYEKENLTLRKRMDSLENNNKTLLNQLHKLQSMMGGKPSGQVSVNHTSTCLMVLALSFSLFLGSWYPIGLYGSESRPAVGSIGMAADSMFGHNAGARVVTAMNEKLQQGGPADAYATPNLRSRTLLSTWSCEAESMLDGLGINSEDELQQCVAEHTAHSAVNTKRYDPVSTVVPPLNTYEVQLSAPDTARNHSVSGVVSELVVKTAAITVNSTE